MNKLAITRIVAVLTGAAVLFGLHQGLGLQFVIALPAALIVYLAVKVAIGLWCGVDGKA